ncbi:hypothetical protein [Streptomyces cinerochromogenes]|uniref:hypothetical protein n=1 Tax=Streptomyces cinerochromogenes TaxID=66422 RepID=UPI0016713D10|nr:hypothetical protein [Streptomyces cinerochromogenes]GGS81094.1 hypothetical protein GCM10010206_49630 [Streptomyces cinerochromogenes]
MKQRTGAGRQAKRACYGTVLPSARQTRRRAAPPAAGSSRARARSANGERMLLPDGTWRRVETIRVRSLFG